MTRIEQITEDRWRFRDLLLLADEDEDMIRRYIDCGSMFVLFADREPAAECIVTDEGDGIYEIKSLACAKKHQRKSYASKLIRFAEAEFSGRYTRMLLGTTPANIAFYEGRGFAVCGSIPGFFRDNYKEPVIENGAVIGDMTLLSKPALPVTVRTCPMENGSVTGYIPEGAPEVALWGHIAPHEACEIALATGAAVFRVDGYDWNADLSPWPAKACFRGGEDFAGLADAHLGRIEQIMTVAEEGLQVRKRGVFGYSLAGLFALYALVRSDRFDGAATASGSMWYDGFLPYLEAHAEKLRGRAVYFSLGDREALTKNARLASVLRCTLAARDLAAASGADTVFIENRGTHFDDGDGRTLAAAVWLAEHLQAMA